MMKKFLFVFLILFACNIVFASPHDALVANLKYDWIDKPILEKEAIVEEIRNEIFTDPIEKRQDLKSIFADKLKDKEHWQHYYAASAGYKEYENYNISAFYYKRMKNIYMYALQDKKDLSHSFYYDAMGHLQYIDFIEGEYPDYPYYATQYRINGTPVSVIYYLSKDCQYLYKPDGTFEGVWFKHKLYNLRNKIILTRTTY